MNEKEGFKLKLKQLIIGITLIGLLLGSITITSPVQAQDEMIYKGYLYEGDHLLLGETAAIQVTEIQKNITGGYGALIAVTDRGKTQNDLVDVTMETDPDTGNLRPDVDRNYLYPGDELDVELEEADITVSVLETTNGGVKLSIKASERMEVGKIPQLVQIKSIEAPSQVGPGKIFEVDVKVKNSGVKRTEGITVGLLANYSSTRNPFTPIQSSTKTISYLDGKEERTLTFKLKASESLPSNNYPLSMRAIYLQDEEQVQTVGTTTVKLKEEPDRGNARLQKVDIPDNIEPGDQFNLTMELKNKGMKDTKNLEITIQSKTSSASTPTTTQQGSLPVQQTGASGGRQGQQNQQEMPSSGQQPQTPGMEGSVSSGSGSIKPVNQGNKKYIEIIKPYKTAKVNYELKVSDQASTGVHSLNLGLDYESDNRRYSEQIQLGILVEGEEDLTIVDTNYAEINPGDEDTEITAIIQNLGTRKAKNIVIEPSIDHPFTATTNQDKQMGSLSSDEKGSITLDLDIADEIDSGKYKIPLNLSYSINNERKSVQKDLEVKITGEPELEIINTEFSPTTPSAGGKVSMIATIKNVGEKEINSVSLQGVDKVNQPVSYTKDEDFIGSLDPGETAQGALKLEFDNDATPKTYQLETMIRGVRNDDVYTFNQYPSIEINGKQTGLIQRIIDLLPFAT